MTAVAELMARAATDLATIGSTRTAAHITAALATLPVLPAADQVSAFGGYQIPPYGFPF